MAFSFIPSNPGALEPGNAPQTALWQRSSAVGPSVSESAGAFEGWFDSDLDAQGQACQILKACCRERWCWAGLNID